MPVSVVSILVAITGLALIAAFLLLFVRSLRGEERATSMVMQILLPLLGAIAVTLNLLSSLRTSTPACAGWLPTLFYAGVLVILVLVVGGTLLFFIGRRRDRRALSLPIVISAVLVTMLFMASYFNGCL